MAKALPSFNLEEYEAKIRDVAAIGLASGAKKVYVQPANYSKLTGTKPGQFVDVLSDIFRSHIDGRRYG